MSLYLIALPEPNEAVFETVRSEWPDNYYQISKNLFMVTVAGVSTPRTIKERVGIGAEAEMGLVVLMEHENTAGTLLHAAVEWYQKAMAA